MMKSKRVPLYTSPFPPVLPGLSSPLGTKGTPNQSTMSDHPEPTGTEVVHVSPDGAVSYVYGPEDDPSYDPFKFLDPREKLFVEEYLKDFNGRQAVIRVWGEGKHPHTASVKASRLLNNVNICVAIERAVAERRQRVQITHDMILREYTAIALSNTINYEINDDGFVTLAEGAPEEAMRAVKAIKRRVRYTPEGDKIVETEIHLWNKLDALKTISQLLGYLVDRREISGPNGRPIQHEHKWIVGGREITF